MTTDTAQILKFLKENVVSLNEAEEDDKDKEGDDAKKDDEVLKEGDDVEGKDSDEKDVDGKVVDMNESLARVKDSSGMIHIVERKSLKKKKAL